MTRLLILLSFIILFGENAFSDCNPYYFRVWPEGSTMNRNPLIIVNFSEPSFFWSRQTKSILPEIGKKIHFFLKSGNSEISLRFIQRNRGQSNENQLLFKPNQLLEPNTKYELVFSCQDSILKNELEERIRFKSKVWVTGELIDRKVPGWLSEPQFQYKNYIQYGCGPESYWRFCMTFEDESEVYVQTIVRHLETGKISEYHLYPDSNSLFVGYGMCGGAFDMIPGGRYAVSFNLVDASGNTANQFTDPIFVRAPLESDYLSEEELEKKKCDCDSTQAIKPGPASINTAWVLAIVGFIVLIACVNWFQAVKKQN